MTKSDVTDSDMVKLLQGSFRQVNFLTEESGEQYGRRLDKREHVLSDTATIEDLGLKWPSFDLTVFTTAEHGGLYGEKLIEACNMSGPGELVHPWLGRMLVYCEECHPSRSIKENGITRFKLTFSPQRNGTLEARELTAEAVRKAAEFVKIDFAGENFTLPSSTASDLNNLADKIAGWQNSIPNINDVMNFACKKFPLLAGSGDGAASTNSVLAATSNFSSFAVRTAQAGLDYLQESDPIDLLIKATSGGQSTAVIGQIERMILGKKIKLPDGVQLDLPNITITDSSRRSTSLGLVVAMERAENILNPALSMTTRIVAVAELARIASGTDYNSSGEAKDFAAQVLTRIENLRQIAPDALQNKLVALRDALSIDMQARAANLPSTQKYFVTETVPAVILAQRLYGDAQRAVEVFDRAAAIHPMAITPRFMEVLRVR